MRRFDVAQHEAAHIVVGMAVGLTVRRAVLEERPNHGACNLYGAVWFHDRHATATQLSLAVAAGCAWDRCVVSPAPRGCDWYDGDAAILRAMGYTRLEIEALVVAASAILAGRMIVHARCASALHDRDLTTVDLASLVAGEWPRDG